MWFDIVCCFVACCVRVLVASTFNFCCFRSIRCLTYCFALCKPFEWENKRKRGGFFFVYFPWLWYTERRRRNEKRLYIVCSAHTQSRIKRNKKNNIGATRLSLRWQQIHTTSARLHTHTTLTKTPKCLHTAHTGNVSSSQNIEERSKQKIYHREIGLYVRCVL